MFSSRPHAFFILALFVPCLWIGYLYNVDLIVLFDTTHLLTAQQWERIYSAAGENGSIGRYFYGPFSLILFGLFGFLPYAAVKAIWLIAQSIGYFLFWWLIGELYPWTRERRYFWFWSLFWFLAVNPLHNNFQSNNIQLYLVVALLGAEWLSRSPHRRASWIAGLLIAAAGAVKVFPYLLFGFYWLAKPRLRPALLTGLLVTLGLPFLVFGPERGLFLYRAFLANVATYGQDNSFIRVEDICCLPSLLARHLYYRWGVAETVSGPYIKLFIVALAGIFLIYVWRKAARFNQRPAGYEAVWPFAFTLLAFLNPSTRPHYYVFYLPALAYLLQRWIEQGASVIYKLMVIGSVILIAASQEGVTGKALNNLLEAWSVPTYGMALLCALALQQMLAANRTGD